MPMFALLRAEDSTILSSGTTSTLMDCPAHSVEDTSHCNAPAALARLLSSRACCCSCSATACEALSPASLDVPRVSVMTVPVTRCIFVDTDGRVPAKPTYTPTKILQF